MTTEDPTSDVSKLLNQGAVEWAITVASGMLQIGRKRAPEFPTEADLATVETLYFLAIKVMQRGRCPDTLLRALGVKWSLSPQLFASRGKDYQRIMDHELPAAGDVVLLQNALPGRVLAQLLSGFSRDAKYWKDHRYFAAETPFHSYFIPKLGVEPASLLEQTANLVAEQLHRAFPDAASQIVSAEFWAHCRSQDAPHQLHYDTDETRLGPEVAGVREGDGEGIPHPVYSTVLFLSGDECGGPISVGPTSGGPTIVLDQRNGDDLAATAWVAHPLQGAILCYPGDLLHGVLPGRVGCADESRTTLIIAFWDSCMCHRRKPGLGAAMRLPEGLNVTPMCSDPVAHHSSSRGSVLHKPPALGIRQDVKQPEVYKVPRVAAWREVPLVTNLPPCSWSGMPLPDLRFFLREASSINNMYRRPAV